VDQLAQGLVQLSRLMGNTSAAGIAQYANAVLTVSKNAGVSVTGVLSFAQAIAPMARQAGIGESAVLGISAAFSKAGADGFVAANTFNSIVSDITNLIQSGSPQLAKYANLIGVSVKQFRSMDKGTAVEDIFTTIAKQGPKAVNTLNRLGIDGVRAQAAIAAVVQSGDLNKSVNDALGASGNTNNLNKASGKAFHGIADDLANVRNEFTQFGTEIGTSFLSPLEVVINGFSKMLHIVNEITKPFSGLIALVSTLAGGLAALGGGALLAAGLMAKLVAVGFVAKSSPVAALRAGYANAAKGTESEFSNRAAANQLRWWQKPGYAAGRNLGGAIGGAGAHSATGMAAEEEAARRASLGLNSTAATSLYTGRHVSVNAMGQEEEAARRRGAFSRGVGMIPRAGTWIAQGQEEYVVNARRSGLDRTPGFAGWAGDKANALKAKFSGGDEKKEAADAKAAAAATRRAEADMRAVESAERLATVEQTLAGEMREFGAAVARVQVQSLRSGAAVAAQGVGGLAAKGAKGAWNMLGPIGVGLLGYEAFSAFGHHDQTQYNQAYVNTESNYNPIQKYNQALGTTATNLAKLGDAATTAADNLSAGLGGKKLSDVGQIGPGDVARAAGNAKYTDDTFKHLANNLTPFQVGKGGKSASTSAVVAYIQQLALTNGGMDNKTLDAVKLDVIRAFGPDKARGIMAQYMRTNPANALDAQVNYGALGGAARGIDNKTFAKYSDAAFSGISSRAANVSGRTGNAAELAQILRFGGAALQGTGPHDNSANIRSFQKNLSDKFGGNPDDFTMLTPGSGVPDNFFKAGYSTQAGVQGQILAALANTGGGRKFLRSAGVDMQQLRGTMNAGFNGMPGGLSPGLGPIVQELLRAQFPASNTSANWQQIAGSGSLGRFAAHDKTVQAAYNTPADPALQYQAMMRLYGAAGGNDPRKSTDQVVAAFDKLQGAIGDTSDQLYVMARAASQFASERQSAALPYLSREQNLGAAAGNYAEKFRANALSPTSDSYPDLQKARQAYDEQEQSYQAYTIQVAQQAKAFGVQMTRAQESNQLQRKRSARDFHIQMLQGEEDYNKQTYRAQRDHAIQQTHAVQTTAQTIYNPYGRVQSAYTSDANTLIGNMGDQNMRLKLQKQELDALSKMGLSDQAIQTLQLASPDNAQQLDRLLMDARSDPSVIVQLNASVGKRVQLTRSLTQNRYNLQFAQTNQDFTRGLSDAAKDYNTQRERAVSAQQRSLGDMAKDFNTMTTQAAQDITTSMTQLYGSYADNSLRAMQAISDNIASRAPKLAKTLTTEIINATKSVNAAAMQTMLASQVGVVGYGPKHQVGSYNAHGKFVPYRGYMNANEAAHLPNLINPGSVAAIGHATGGISTRAHVANISEGNKAEAIIPLDQRGLAYMTQWTNQVTMTLLRTMMGRTNPLPGRGTGGGGDSYTRIDQSTRFTGDITVQAQDPTEMQRKLDQKKRLDALSNPGSRRR
jgi:TP901 family phage tail tape measure protein